MQMYTMHDYAKAGFILVIFVQIVSIKKQMISQRCIACGHTSNVDMRHKLTTFILKNPPDQDLQATTPSKGKKSKKDKV